MRETLMLGSRADETMYKPKESVCLDKQFEGLRKRASSHSIENRSQIAIENYNWVNTSKGSVFQKRNRQEQLITQEPNPSILKSLNIEELLSKDKVVKVKPQEKTSQHNQFTKALLNQEKKLNMIKSIRSLNFHDCYF